NRASIQNSAGCVIATCQNAPCAFYVDVLETGAVVDLFRCEVDQDMRAGGKQLFGNVTDIAFHDSKRFATTQIRQPVLFPRKNMDTSCSCGAQHRRTDKASSAQQNKVHHAFTKAMG